MSTNLVSDITLYRESEKYINPSIISQIIVNELKISMSYNEIIEFIKNCKISITETEIRTYLDKKMDEEDPALRTELEEINKPLSKSITEWTEEDINISVRKLGVSLLREKYRFEPYSLHYFKTYTSILKSKCKTLFSIVDNLEKLRNGNIAEEDLTQIIDLDFHINEDGDIYLPDAKRLIDAIIYNVNDLYDKINLGNNCKTYLTFKESPHKMGRDGVFESEIYPSKKIQIKDLSYGNCKEFIALSENQKKILEQQRIDSISYWITRCFMDDEVEESINPDTKTKQTSYQKQKKSKSNH